MAGSQLILQLHRWDVEHEHGPLGDPELRPYGNGVLFWFELNDFEAAVRRAADMKVTTIKERHLSENGNWECWMRDPDGYTVVVTSPLHTMNSARSLFILAAIPFSLLAILLLFMDKAFRTGGSTGNSMVFVFCGGIYIYGSIYALRGHLPLSLLVFAGCLLNLIGAFVWVPMFRFSDGAAFGLIGLGLTLAWIITIFREYRAERH